MTAITTDPWHQVTCLPEGNNHQHQRTAVTSDDLTSHQWYQKLGRYVFCKLVQNNSPCLKKSNWVFLIIGMTRRGITLNFGIDVALNLKPALCPYVIQFKKSGQTNCNQKISNQTSTDRKASPSPRDSTTGCQSTATKRQNNADTIRFD